MVTKPSEDGYSIHVVVGCEPFPISVEQSDESIDFHLSMGVGGSKDARHLARMLMDAADLLDRRVEEE